MKTNGTNPGSLLALGLVLLLATATACAQTLTTLHSFTVLSGSNDTNLDGATPQAGLISSGGALYGTADYGGTGGNGTVFTVTTGGTGFTNLHNFTPTIYTASFGLPTSDLNAYTNSDGANPSLSLLVSSNTLYGTTSEGGTGGNGTVFAVNTDGTGFTNLHSFTAIYDYSGTNRDGAYPDGLVLSGNTLYGAAAFGGSNGYGTLFAINTDGTGFRILHGFTVATGPDLGTNGDGTEPGTMIVSGNTLYGTSGGGGLAGNGTVFTVTTNGTGFTTWHSFTTVAGSKSTNSDGAYPVALLLSGNTLYGTASGGGLAGNGTVFAITNNGAGFTTLHGFTAQSGANKTNSDGAIPQAGLVLAGNTLYGTAFDGGTGGNGTVFAVNPNGTGFTNVYNFTAGNLNIEGEVTNQDGANPLQLILLGNTLYGAAENGGNVGYGTVFGLSLPAPPAFIGGTAFADSASFPLNTTGVSPILGGTASADSASFTLNTTGVSPVIGGAASADSASFTLNTVGGSPSIGGASYADSGNFTINTAGVSPIVGGATSADSADFTLNTTGVSLIVGGASYADSASFTLNVSGFPLAPILLVAVVLTPGPNFQFTLPGPAGSQFVVQATTSFSPGVWVSLVTNVAPFTFVDPGASNFAQRFYRVLFLP